MKSQKPKKLLFEKFGVHINTISIAKLFNKYEEIGFIYPEKKALLAPYIQRITQNWKALGKSKEELLWILTHEAENERAFASVSFWKHSNYGLMAQHLVSSGNPFLSLKVMLAAQFKAEHHHGEDEVKSSQNWFRPNNRYAYRVFASMCEKLGPKMSSLRSFQYLHLPLYHIQTSIQKAFLIEEVRGKDQDLMDFVSRNYNEVFVKAEELDQEDIALTHIGTSYAKCGLARSRKVLKFRHHRTGKILAVLVANRAPLGLNFSFLENRAYYILDESLDRNYRAIMVNVMNNAIEPYYRDFPLSKIPILTDKLTAKVQERQGAEFVREYMQSIWLREGFSLWYEHIQSFLKKIESRAKRSLKSAKGANYVCTI